MGYWIGFNKKSTRLTFLKGKKTHSYKVKSWFKGRFFGKYAIEEKGYRKKKEEALFMIDEDPNSKKMTFTDKRHQQGFYLMCHLAESQGKTHKEIAEALKEKKMPISPQNVQQICAKVREVMGITRENKDLAPLNTINI